MGIVFLTISVRKGVSNFAILVIKRVWFLYSSLELGMFLEEATFSSSVRPSIRALHSAFNIGIGQNSVANYMAGLKQGINLGSGHK